MINNVLREPHQYADNAKGVNKIARSFNSLQKTIHELSNKPWSLLKNNATMSETFCQTHGVHIPKWEWKESIAT